MPAFYSASSQFDVDERVDSGEDVSRIADARRDLGLDSALLVTVPVPAEFEIDAAEIESLIAAALREAQTQSVAGKNLTPFLLNELSQKSGGKTLAANVALLENNARVAAEIAGALNF